MNKSIYNICEHIINQLPQVKYFGLYRNQFNNSNKDREINYPAVLLEIKPIVFNQQLGYNQDATVTISLHVGMQVVNNIEKGDKKLDNSLDMIELIDDIHDVFDGFNGLEYSGITESHVSIGEFTRLMQSSLTNNKSIWIGKIDYTFKIVVAHKTQSTTTINLDSITVETSNYI